MKNKPFPKQPQAPLAPNDPNRVPKSHRKLINDLYNILSTNGYNIFDGQTVCQAVSVLKRVADLGEAIKTVDAMVAAMIAVDVKAFEIEAILQLLQLKMTESVNQTPLSDISFEAVSEE